MDLKYEIGNRLKMVREYFGETQIQFGLRLHLKGALASKYERGELELPDKVKKELSKIGISIDWLITGNGEMLIAPPTIGERLQKTREDTKISIETIARVLEVDQKTYLHIERDELQPTDDQLQRFANLTNRDFNWLKKGYQEQDIVTPNTFRNLFPDVMRMLDENTKLNLQLSEIEDILEIWGDLTYNQKSMVIVTARALAKENAADGKAKK